MLWGGNRERFFHINPLKRGGKITFCPSDVILDVTCQIILQNKPPSTVFSYSFYGHTQRVYCISSSIYLFIYLFIYLYLPAGPGPVDTPAVSKLHPRSVTITWDPPSEPNGVITSYTLYLCLSSVCSSLNYSLGHNLSLLPKTEGAYLNSGHNPIPTSHLTTTGSSFISMSAVKTGSNDSSSTIQGTKPNTLPHHFSSMRPGTTDDNQSTRGRNTSQGPSSISLPGLFLSYPYNASSSNSEQDPFLGPVSGLFSAASDSSSSPLSVTVPGNTTSYTFLDLLPYQTYSLQVQHDIKR